MQLPPKAYYVRPPHNSHHHPRNRPNILPPPLKEKLELGRAHRQANSEKALNYYSRTRAGRFRGCTNLPRRSGRGSARAARRDVTGRQGHPIGAARSRIGCGRVRRGPLGLLRGGSRSVTERPAVAGTAGRPAPRAAPRPTSAREPAAPRRSHTDIDRGSRPPPGRPPPFRAGRRDPRYRASLAGGPDRGSSIGRVVLEGARRNRLRLGGLVGV